MDSAPKELLSPIQEQSIKPSKEPKRFSRRRFLSGSAGVAAGSLLTLVGCTNPETALAPPPTPTQPSPPTPEPSPTADVDIPSYFFDRPAAIAHAKNIEVNDTFAAIERVLNPGLLDPQYLETLIKKLEENIGTTERRMQTLLHNLCKLDTLAGDLGGSATGLMVDESGIFIAAGHSFGNYPRSFKPVKNLNLITHIATEKIYMIREFMVMPEVDIAIVYAPTGKPRKPIDNIQMNTVEPSEGEDLWSWGVVTKPEANPPSYNYGIVHGKMTKKLNVTEELPYREMLHAEDLKSWGGLSGSPMINRRGHIVGVLSGGYPNESKSFNDLKGTRFTKISALKDLVSKGKPAVYSTGFGFTDENK
ncbi:MAG: hypothetical protein G01um10145_648 [Microgenomates group bacterium Gr01-1014_5]|nr:MAG: hypothetical protein G01um10145_648 [Microgenomates group bacterium Gr01-1014_5]